MPAVEDTTPNYEHHHNCPQCFTDWECDDSECDPEEDRLCPNCEYEDPMER